MKRVLQAVAVSLLLTGCMGVSDDDAGSDKPLFDPSFEVQQPEKETDAERTVRIHDDALALAREQYPRLAEVPESTIDETAHQVCTSLDSGLSMDLVLQASLEGAGSGFADEAAAIIAYGVFVFCPEYKGDILGLGE